MVLTVISITAFLLAVITIIFVIHLDTYLDILNDNIEDVNRYTDVLSDKINKQRADFNRSLLTAERKEKELDERMNLLQCRLNQDRMQGIIDGKITE
jgi:uncharacterized protein YoxC